VVRPAVPPAMKKFDKASFGGTQAAPGIREDAAFGEDLAGGNLRADRNQRGLASEQPADSRDRARRDAPRSKTREAFTGTTRRLRLLVAEDNALNQRVVLKIVEELGLHADVAGNGRDAIEARERVPYDIIFMDCQMPVLDGFAAAAEIRKREGNARHSVIVAMTANALGDDPERCLAAGMDDYISKPVRSCDFAQAIRTWQPVPAGSV